MPACPEEQGAEYGMRQPPILSHNQPAQKSRAQDTVWVRQINGAKANPY